MENKTKILKKLSLIMGEIGTIEKDKTNNFQNYQYLSEAAIKRTVQPLLVKYGVIIAPFITKKVTTSYDKTNKQGQVSRESFTEISMTIHFMDSESGELLEIIVAGDGTDSGDKGLYKAITGALKYALTTVFLIPTETDPENEKAEANTTKKTSDKEVIDYDQPPFEDAPITKRKGL